MNKSFDDKLLDQLKKLQSKKGNTVALQAVSKILNHLFEDMPKDPDTLKNASFYLNDLAQTIHNISVEASNRSNQQVMSTRSSLDPFDDSLMFQDLMDYDQVSENEDEVFLDLETNSSCASPQKGRFHDDSFHLNHAFHQSNHSTLVENHTTNDPRFHLKTVPHRSSEILPASSTKEQEKHEPPYTSVSNDDIFFDLDISVDKKNVAHKNNGLSLVTKHNIHDEMSQHNPIALCSKPRTGRLLSNTPISMPKDTSSTPSCSQRATVDTDTDTTKTNDKSSMPLPSSSLSYSGTASKGFVDSILSDETKGSLRAIFSQPPTVGSDISKKKDGLSSLFQTIETLTKATEKLSQNDVKANQSTGKNRKIASRLSTFDSSVDSVNDESSFYNQSSSVVPANHGDKASHVNRFSQVPRVSRVDRTSQVGHVSHVDHASHVRTIISPQKPRALSLSKPALGRPSLSLRSKSSTVKSPFENHAWETLSPSKGIFSILPQKTTKQGLSGWETGKLSTTKNSIIYHPAKAPTTTSRTSLSSSSSSSSSSSISISSPPASKSTSTDMVAFMSTSLLSEEDTGELKRHRSRGDYKTPKKGKDNNSTVDIEGKTSKPSSKDLKKGDKKVMISPQRCVSMSIASGRLNTSSTSASQPSQVQEKTSPKRIVNYRRADDDSSGDEWVPTITPRKKEISKPTTSRNQKSLLQDFIVETDDDLSSSSDMGGDDCSFTSISRNSARISTSNDRKCTHTHSKPKVYENSLKNKNNNNLFAFESDLISDHSEKEDLAQGAVYAGYFDILDKLDQNDKKMKSATPSKQEHLVRTPIVQTPKKNETKTMAPLTGRSFARSKNQMALDLYKQCNEIVYKNALPVQMEISWTERLQRTAGRALCKVNKLTGARSASIELASKIITSEDKLRDTLLHEICHVAAHIIDKVTNPPHGAAFKAWARQTELYFRDVSITTCHNYEIVSKFLFECVKEGCGQTYGRQSNSITDRHRCHVCQSALQLKGKFHRDGTPIKERQASKYTKYIQSKMAEIKAKNPNLQQSEIMKLAAAQYQSEKATMMDTDDGDGDGDVDDKPTLGFPKIALDFDMDDDC